LRFVCLFVAHVVNLGYILDSFGDDSQAQFLTKLDHAVDDQVSFV
jgi:hypothetical protein